MLGAMMFKQTQTPFDVPGNWPGVEGGGWLLEAVLLPGWGWGVDVGGVGGVGGCGWGWWMVWGVIGDGGGVLSQVLDRDAQHRLSTRNATRVKRGSKLYILPNFDGKYDVFLIFAKIQGSKLFKFSRDLSRGIEMVEHM